MNYNQYDPMPSFSQNPYQSQQPINPYYYQQAPQLVKLANILDEKNGTDIVMEPIDMYNDSMYGKLSRVLYEKD